MRKLRISTKLAKEYFKKLDVIDGEFWQRIQGLEETMQRETGIKDIEFFWSDGSIVGIGNTSRTMKLIQRWLND